MKMKILTLCSALLLLLAQARAGTEETSALLYLSKYGYISNNDARLWSVEPTIPPNQQTIDPYSILNRLGKP